MFSWNALVPDFILMEFNVNPDRAHMFDEYLESDYICLIDWPVRFTDLNPVQTVWGVQRREIVTLFPSPRTIQCLKAPFLEKWDRLPQEFINCLGCNHIGCKSCIILKGKNISYEPIFLFMFESFILYLHILINLTHFHECLL